MKIQNPSPRASGPLRLIPSVGGALGGCLWAYLGSPQDWECLTDRDGVWPPGRELGRSSMKVTWIEQC